MILLSRLKFEHWYRTHMNIENDLDAEKREREFFANLPKITSAEVLKRATDSTHMAWARVRVLEAELRKMSNQYYNLRMKVAISGGLGLLGIALAVAIFYKAAHP